MRRTKTKPRTTHSQPVESALLHDLSDRYRTFWCKVTWPKHAKPGNVENVDSSITASQRNGRNETTHSMQKDDRVRVVDLGFNEQN